MSPRPMQTILYVDDEPDLREVATLALEAVGQLEVTSVGSGAEALAAVSSHIPDLFLLDVMMPDMDGPATMAALRQIPAAASVPVVFMTAKAQREEIQALLDLGAIAVLPKPFDPMTLADDLKTIWDQHHGG